MRYPGAQWKPITVNYDTGGCHPRYLVWHIMQGTLTGTDSWFRNSAAQVSAHFGVGKTGTVIQWVDTADTAWHAVGANTVSIGVEHEGNAGEALTAAQLAATAALYAWAHKNHPIPLALTSDPVHGSGLAWHGLGGASWGDHPDCPGTPVVDQRAAGLAAAVAIVNPPILTYATVTADGTQTLAQVAATHKTAPAGILRCTAVQDKLYPAPVAAWLNGVFGGTLSPLAPVPKGVVLRVPLP